MSLFPESVPPIPADTARVAHAAFPKGALAIRIRDALGTIYTDDAFADLFAPNGQPALSPWRLALVLVLQFVEGLSDRQAADAVRGRIEWKYALSLELTDPGFDFSVLSEFRDRLLKDDGAERILDSLLQCLRDQNLLQARGTQRTDSTHVLAAVRALNRLELVLETLRAALNALAAEAPFWLEQVVPQAWYTRYSARAEESRLPKTEAERQRLAAQIGQDGLALFALVCAPDAPAHVRHLPAVENLRQTWLFQFYAVADARDVTLRAAADLPPAGQRWDSPYDPEMRYGNKRTHTWEGYKVHATETCDPETLHVITHVDTTPAHVTDSNRTAAIHQALAAKDLLPAVHLMDAGYVDADLLVSSQEQYGITLHGPVRSDTSWQAKDPEAYGLDAFSIDWERQQATCPQGHTSTTTYTRTDTHGSDLVHFKFSRPICRQCPERARCTQSKDDPRKISVRPQAQHEALKSARQAQQTEPWKESYQRRAGIEGTLSQGIRAFGLRCSRYVGEAKTHLQHVLTATAINLVRFDAWQRGQPHAQTRTSRFAELQPQPVLAA
jgi:transposase